MSLAQIQQRLWRLIAWPEGVRPALSEEPAGTPALETLITSDERLGAEDRLDVYANAYFYRIHDVLAEDFPTLEGVLAEEDFHDLVTSYLAVHPSRSPSLRWIGDRLPGFIARHDAASSIRAGCPFAGDLAEYEWATEAVFDAADAEPALREDLAAIAPEDWGALPLRLSPSVRLLRLDWPVHLLRAAQREEQPLPEIDREPTDLCLWRHDERVVHREIDPRESRALRQVRGGTDFGGLCVAVAEDVGEDEAPSLAATWLARWLEDGLIRAISPAA